MKQQRDIGSFSILNRWVFFAHDNWPNMNKKAIKINELLTVHVHHSRTILNQLVIQMSIHQIRIIS